MPSSSAEKARALGLSFYCVWWVQVCASVHGCARASVPVPVVRSIRSYSGAATYSSNSITGTCVNIARFNIMLRNTVAS